METPTTHAASAGRVSRRSFVRLAAATALGASALGGLTGCGSDASSSDDGASDAAPDPLIIACLAREEPDVLWLADKLSDTYNIESQVFSDNNAINEATLDGSVAVNYFQNVTYLDSWNESHDSDLVFYGGPVFHTCDLLVSKTAKTVDELADGAQVLVANDSANQARELQLLEAAGLITLDSDAELPTIYDIVDNPKNLDIIEVDPRSRVGAFADVDAMVAPSITVYQMDDPDVTVEGALYAEEPEVYRATGGTGFVVTSEVAAAEPAWLVDLYAATQTQEFADFIEETYAGAKIPAYGLE
jgi:D-methionine transport system substrate-binding protein